MMFNRSNWLHATRARYTGCSGVGWAISTMRVESVSSRPAMLPPHGLASGNVPTSLPICLPGSMSRRWAGLIGLVSGRLTSRKNSSSAISRLPLLGPLRQSLGRLPGNLPRHRLRGARLHRLLGVRGTQPHELLLSPGFRWHGQISLYSGDHCSDIVWTSTRTPSVASVHRLRNTTSTSWLSLTYSTPWRSEEH